MRRRICRFLLICASTMLMLGLLTVGANASNYPYGKMTFSSMPSDWYNVTVQVGDVTMPLERFPDGYVTNDSEVEYVSSAELKEYGITNTSSPIYVRGWTCVGFARHVYAALFYKYPQNATVDTALGTSYANSSFYYDVIMEIYGTKELAAGYSAATLKELFSYCRPGAVFSTTNSSGYNHTMVIMAIYDDGFLIYDCNFSDYYEVDVRKYTWQEFVDYRGQYNIAGLHMPKYYPGFTYSKGSGTEITYTLDTSTAGEYVVYNCSALNVRSLPSIASTAVGSLTSGTTVQVAGTYNNWAQITYQNGSYWVYTDYIKPVNSEITVTFNGNGATPSFTSRTYTVGQAFGTMPTASKTNRVLIGWANGSTVYYSDSIVPSADSLTLKAKWGVLTFLDVDEDAWYAGTVESMTNLGLFSKASYFNPGKHATRAQFVTVLGREYERESGTTIARSGNAGYSDVVSGSYYSRYVVWGKEIGIVKGYSSSQFGTNDDVTREQMVTFLYRLAEYSGFTDQDSADSTKIKAFPDSGNVSSYAVTPMAWAINVGIIIGDDAGKLRPLDSCTRAEMATMFSRYKTYYDTHAANVSAAVLAGQMESAAETGGVTQDAETTETAELQPENEAAEPTAENQEAAEPEPVEETGEGTREAVIPPPLEGMINVIFDLDGGELEEPEEAAEDDEAVALQEESAAEESGEPADPRITEPQKYGARYVLCRRPGEKLEVLLPVPVKENMVFLGWFCGDEEYTAESLIPVSADPEQPVTELVLTAKWAPVQELIQ